MIAVSNVQRIGRYSEVSKNFSSQFPPKMSTGKPTTPKKRSRNVGVPQFLTKLTAILLEESTEIIRWSHDGRSFQVLDIEALEETILQHYYKHRKWSSFQRQLNNFGFRKWTKTQAVVCTFSHPDFLQEDPDRMKTIGRNNKPEKPGKEDVLFLAASKKIPTNNHSHLNGMRAYYPPPTATLVNRNFLPMKKQQTMDYQPPDPAWLDSLFEQPPIVQPPIVEQTVDEPPTAATLNYENRNTAKSMDVSASISFEDMVQDISEEDLLMDFWQSPKGLEDLILFGDSDF